MKEETLTSNRAFNGRLINLDVVEVSLESGRKARREIVRHPGAVLVVGELPGGRFVFVRQFRKPIDQELLEVVAGTRDPDEDAETCAIREMREETGYEVKTLSRMGFVYTAPGFCNERIDLFFAELSGTPETQRTDEDETIEVVLLDFSEIESMIARNEIHDGKTLVAWLMAKPHIS